MEFAETFKEDDMSRETDKVIAGFMRLNSAEQEMVVREVMEYLKKELRGNGK